MEDRVSELVSSLATKSAELPKTIGEAEASASKAPEVTIHRRPYDFLAFAVHLGFLDVWG